MAQTAIEWLEKELMRTNRLYTKEEICKQAKEMEKQQIIDFGNKMQLVKDVDFDGNIEFIFNPEQYYKEQFNK